MLKLGKRQERCTNGQKNIRKDVEHHLVVRGTQVKTTVRDHLTPIEMAITQKRSRN